MLVCLHDFMLLIFVVISGSASDCLGKLVSEMTCYVLSGTQ